MVNAPITPLSDEEFAALQAALPSSTFLRQKERAPVRIEEVVTSVADLSIEDLGKAEERILTGVPLGVTLPELKNIRHTHHRLAQYIAGGMEDSRAAVLCNYSINRVSILKSTPAFQELLAHYKATVDEEFTDFVSVAAGLGLDALQELQRRLDETPEQFSVNALLELTKTVADRSGNAPVSRSLNVNMNLGLGDRLKAARERANAAANGP